MDDHPFFRIPFRIVNFSCVAAVTYVSYARLVEQLEKFFSQEISIKRSKNGGGRIVIDFSDDRDIDRFIEKFEKRGASAEIRNNK